MICDKLAAGIVYQGKNWTKEYQLSYWEKERKKVRANEKIQAFIEAVFVQVAKDGIDKTLTKNNIREIYKKYCK